jgi:hypothetical protein
LGDVGSKGFIGIGGIKRVSNKNRGLFYWKNVLGGGSIKGFWEVFIHI